MLLIDILLGAWVAWGFIQLAITICHIIILILLMPFAFAADAWAVLNGRQKFSTICRNLISSPDQEGEEESDEDEPEWWLYE